MAERRRPRQPQQPSPPQPVTAEVVRAYWRADPQVPVLYADQLAIHQSEGQFILTFGLIEQPYEPVTDELRERVKKEGLPVLQVARVAVSAARMEQIIPVLTGFYETLRQAHEPQKPSEAGE